MHLLEKIETFAINVVDPLSPIITTIRQVQGNYKESKASREGYYADNLVDYTSCYQF